MRRLEAQSVSRFSSQADDVGARRRPPVIGGLLAISAAREGSTNKIH